MFDSQYAEERERGHLKRTVKTLMGDASELRQRIIDRQMAHWKRLLGSRLQEMMSSRSTTISFISDPEICVKRGALSLMAYYWDPDPSLEASYVQIAQSDQDADVRAAAVSCLIALYAVTTSARIKRICAELVSDELSPITVRKTAYLGILQMQVPDSPELFQASISLMKSGFEEIVDWDLVNSCLGTL